MLFQDYQKHLVNVLMGEFCKDGYAALQERMKRFVDWYVSVMVPEEPNISTLSDNLKAVKLCKKAVFLSRVRQRES